MSQNLKYLKYKKKYIDLKDKVSNENILLGGARCDLNGYNCKTITKNQIITDPKYNDESKNNYYYITKDHNLTHDLMKVHNKEFETLVTYKINGSDIEKINTALNFFDIEYELKHFINSFTEKKKTT